MSYNLLDEGWIPILYADGKLSHVGIKEAFTQASGIRQIAASNPMDRVAVFRFLLALLYWCQGNPPVTTGVTSERLFSLDRFTKLDANRECFNLLGGGKRFYQYRQVGDKPLTVNYLVHEIPAGTNYWHFRHATDAISGLCPACCALGLLRLPAFSTQGGQGKSPGINDKPPIYVVPSGETLAETLFLSWRPVKNLGSPAWEKPDLQLPKNGEIPLLTGLTWLPRRVWLGEPQEPLARCISCGKQDHLILSSVFAGRGSNKIKGQWRDPQVVYLQNMEGDSLHSVPPFKKAAYKVDPYKVIDDWACQWAGTMSELLQNPPDENVMAWVVGFSSDRMKYWEVHESFLPWSGLEEQLKLCIEMLMAWQVSNSNLYGELKRFDVRDSSATESLDRPEIKSLLAAVHPQIESRVMGSANHLLTDGEPAWQDARKEYKPLMNLIAGALAPGITIASVRRRKEIARVLHRMSLQPAKTMKPAKPNGGKNESNAYRTIH